MDWFPLLNSLRVASLATIITFFTGIFAAAGVMRCPRWLKGALDCLLTLPLVLPPTVVGFFLLKSIGPKSVLGSFLLDTFSLKMTMVWYSAVFATTIVAFPLMYRTARGALEAVDPDQLTCARSLGLSGSYIFWRVRLPACKSGLLAGTVLAFARALGEYGATSMVTGYIPGRTATVATTVYQLWREGNDALAYRWVVLDVSISLLVLAGLNALEKRKGGARREH